MGYSKYYVGRYWDFSGSLSRITLGRYIVITFLDLLWSILSALKLRDSNFYAGKMDQTWSSIIPQKNMLKHWRGATADLSERLDSNKTLVWALRLMVKFNDLLLLKVMTAAVITSIIMIRGLCRVRWPVLSVPIRWHSYAVLRTTIEE